MPAAKFACAAWGFRHYNLDDFLAAARRLDLDAVEIQVRENGVGQISPEASAAELQQAVRQAADAGVTLAAVAGGNDFTMADPVARRQQVDAVRRQVDTTAGLGAGVLRLFAGWVGDQQISDATFGYVRECLEALAPYAAERGVTLAIENHGGITRTGAQCRRLLEGLPPVVGLNYDPANFRHVDEDPLAALRVTADLVVYSHWKDVRLLQEAWDYCAVGEGIIGWEPIVTDLLVSYDGYWAIEYETVEDVERGTAVSLQYLRDLVARGG